MRQFPFSKIAAGTDAFHRVSVCGRKSRQLGRGGTLPAQLESLGIMNANGSRLDGLTRDLWNQWLLTKEYWQDTKSEEFGQKYLEELLSSVNKTVGVIEQLDKVISKIKRDCE
jgi:hypothetical protein